MRGERGMEDGEAGRPRGVGEGGGDSTFFGVVQGAFRSWARSISGGPSRMSVPKTIYHQPHSSSRKLSPFFQRFSRPP